MCLCLVAYLFSCPSCDLCQAEVKCRGLVRVDDSVAVQVPVRCGWLSWPCTWRIVQGKRIVLVPLTLLVPLELERRLPIKVAEVEPFILTLG